MWRCPFGGMVKCQLFGGILFKYGVYYVGVYFYCQTSVVILKVS